MRLRSFLKYVFRERVGFKRPSPVTPEDHRKRQEFLDREAELRRAIQLLDSARDNWSMRRSRTRPH